MNQDKPIINKVNIKIQSITIGRTTKDAENLRKTREMIENKIANKGEINLKNQRRRDNSAFSSKRSR